MINLARLLAQGHSEHDEKARQLRIRTVRILNWTRPLHHSTAHKRGAPYSSHRTPQKIRLQSLVATALLQRISCILQSVFLLSEMSGPLNAHCATKCLAQSSRVTRTMDKGSKSDLLPQNPLEKKRPAGAGLWMEQILGLSISRP